MIKDGGGDHTSPTVGLGKTFMVKDDVCIASQNVILVPNNTDNNLKYIYYTLSLKIKELRDLSNKSINLEHLSVKSILDFPIQLPPLPIQQEIVATLDRIYAPGTTELADTLKMTDRAMDLVLAQPNGTTLEPIVEAQRLVRKSAQMVADVRAQMVAIMKSVERRGFSSVKLNDLYDKPKIGKKFNSGDMDNQGVVPFFNGKWNSPTGTHSEISYTSDKDYFVIIKDGGGDHTSDTVGMGKFFKVRGPCAITSHNYVLSPKVHVTDTTHQYVHYVMTMNIKELRDKARYSLSLGSISIVDILEFSIPLPPLHFQQSLLSRLDALQSQLTALESLQRQSEDNARFILESYLGSGSVPNPPRVSDDSKEEMQGGSLYVEEVQEDTLPPSEVAAQAASTASSPSSPSSHDPPRRMRKPRLHRKE